MIDINYFLGINEENILEEIIQKQDIIEQEKRKKILKRLAEENKNKENIGNNFS